MSDYYLVPKQDIQKLEKAREALSNINRVLEDQDATISLLAISSAIYTISDGLYYVTHRKYSMFQRIFWKLGFIKKWSK